MLTLTLLNASSEVYAHTRAHTHGDVCVHIYVYVRNAHLKPLVAARAAGRKLLTPPHPAFPASLLISLGLL